MVDGIVALAGGLGRAAAWLLVHPPAAIVALASIGIAVLVGTGRPGVATAVAAGLAALVAGSVLPRPVRRVVWGPVIMWWRYQRRWAAVMAAVGLGRRVDGVDVAPRLVDATADAGGDVLTVRLAPGQRPEDLDDVADALAHTLSALAVRVVVLRPGWVRLRVWRTDPLATPIPPLPPEREPDLAALRVGVDETAGAWRVRLLGAHVLVAGVTGAGKGSVLWSLLAALAPAIRDGRVVVWAVDPKGGMELGLARGLFARFAVTPADTAALLDDAVDVLRERAGRLAGVTRLHTPTPAEPLVVVVVDEVAALTAYLADRRLRERIDQSLAVLLTQGRAVGVSVVAALQDPRKEVLRTRNLFPVKIALRLDEASQVDMVLGDGARRAGAHADRIPDTTPGVGYVRVDGTREPVRVRAAYHTDADLHTLTRAVAPPPTPSPENSVEDAAGRETATPLSPAACLPAAQPAPTRASVGERGF